MTYSFLRNFSPRVRRWRPANRSYPGTQSAVPHKGWENEHLATFLLSRIAFVASPVKVGDDVGTDVFCTLFEVTKHKERDVLLPRELDPDNRSKAIGTRST